MAGFDILAYLSTAHLIVLGVIGLLIFGHRLPEVARSLGKAFVEFKRGLQNVKDEMESPVPPGPPHLPSSPPPPSLPEQNPAAQQPRS